MKKISLTKGKFALVDNEDYKRVSKYKWHYVGNGSAAHRVYRTSEYIYMHRLIMNTPSGLEVDHINHNKLDNRKKNLRNCTRGENARNQVIRSDNTIGYKGVRFDDRNAHRKWNAVIWLNGKLNHLGSFKTKEEAATAYDDAAVVYHGKFAYKNQA